MPDKGNYNYYNYYSFPQLDDDVVVVVVVLQMSSAKLQLTSTSKSHENVRENDFRNCGVTSWMSTFRLSCFDRDVTPLPTRPQGTMLLNHFMSVLQFKASP